MRRAHLVFAALVAWYLMVPPVLPNEEPDIKARLSRWTIRFSFDEADQCERVRAGYHAAAEKSDDRFDLMFANFARCIDTRDPRLAQR
jgi:hypothetical protein